MSVVRRRYRTGLGPAVAAGGALMGYGSRVVQRFRPYTIPSSRPRNMTLQAQEENRTSSIAQPVVSGHHDYATVYKRRRQPYRKRKRWVKFTRKVQRVIEKQVSPKFQVILSQSQMASIANKQDKNSVATVLGSYGSAGYANDIEQLFARDTGIERIHLTGYLMETMITNTGANECYLDCYYWVARKSVPVGDAGNVDALIINGLSKLDARFPVGGSSLDINDYGCTPFQSGDFTRAINAYKKVRVKLGPGATTQLKIGGKLSNFINKDSASKYTFIRGLSRGIFFVCYGTPNATNTVASPTALNISVNRSLTYRVTDLTVPSGGTTQA